MSTRMGGTTLRFLQEENQRLMEQNEELSEENLYLRGTLKSLRGLMGTVARFDVEADLNRLLNRIVYEAVRIVDAVDGSLLLVDEEKQELVVELEDKNNLQRGKFTKLYLCCYNWIANEKVQERYRNSTFIS